MLGSAHPAHRAVVLRRPATSAVLSAVFARATLPPSSAPVARSPSSPNVPTPCAPPSQIAHRPPPLDRGSESRWRGLVVGARVTERVVESPGAGARAAVMGESRGEGEERWRGEGVAVGGAEREVGGEGGANEQDPPALPAAFEGVQRWVVFSDLHVSRRNAELCAALLTHVHQLTKDRCVRQSIPSLPSLPLSRDAHTPLSPPRPSPPGQVSVDGTQHALAVLARINRHIVVLSCPTVLLAALWLPFRHHAPLLTAAMHQALHAPPTFRPPPICAMFMHADVEGARRSSMEGAITLLGEGLGPLLLPPGLPHIFGEAGQSKRALVLRGGTLEHVENIPLDVGPRHFIIPAASASASQPGEGEGESEWQAGEGWQQAVVLLRAGDLVRWEVLGGAGTKETREELASLRATGALVQTVASQALSHPPRILQADTLVGGARACIWGDTLVGGGLGRGVSAG
ncbi:unnamed protein product [Closterium sp. Naga37s-1]|nr:unnamed protein product [Closterium sp. Naga37s-1]